MRNLNEDNITRAVLAMHAGAKDARLKAVMMCSIFTPSHARSS